MSPSSLLFDPTLYFVTPPIYDETEQWIRLIEEAVLGGVTMVQIRDKQSSTKRIMEVTRMLQPFLRDKKIPLLLNDRADIAHALGADGVHLGQTDLPIRAARKLLGKKAIIGVSLETTHQIDTIASADYVAASPVFLSLTKGTEHAWGLDGLRALRSLVVAPLVAIGGITVDHVHALLEAGADGIAVVSALAQAPDPRKAAEEFIVKYRTFCNETDRFGRPKKR